MNVGGALLQKSTRPSFSDIWMEMAKALSKRSTCDRSHVGCVLVANNRLVSAGYNGSLSRFGHCDDIGHLMVGGHCFRTVHAEVNAVSDAAYRGVSISGAIAYTTLSPCVHCYKTLVQAGIEKIYYKKLYKVVDEAWYGLKMYERVFPFTKE